MTKEEAQLHYAAYAELERAAEAFYTAAYKLAGASPDTARRLMSICEDINCVMISVDDELDEVL